MADKIMPIKPTFFDKKGLNTPEFGRYVYEIAFKKSGKTVRDMNVAGYVHALNPYIKSIQSELLHYGVTGDGRILRAVVRSTVTVSFKTSDHSTGVTNDLVYTALGDGDVTDVPSAGTLVRTVETRALKRALARVMDISKADLNEGFIEEDEIGTPLNNGRDGDENKSASGRKSPQDIAREHQREMDEKEEAAGDDDSGTPTSESPGDDW